MRSGNISLTSAQPPLKVQPVSPQDLRYIRGIGPKRVEALARIGIHTLKDLLYHFPARYEDRSKFMQVSDLIPGEPATLQLEVLKVRLRPVPRLPIVELVAGDQSGTIICLWYRQTYLLKAFRPGQKILIYGRPQIEGRKIQFSSPEFETIDDEGPSIHTGRIVPVYSLTEGLYQKSLRQIIHSLSQSEQTIHWPDYLPQFLQSKINVIPLGQALRQIHFPKDQESLETSRRRIIFDEFFSFQLNLLSENQKNRERSDGIALPGKPELEKEFIRSLPFDLTRDQIKAIKEVRSDLALARPMNRMLQGDVGSGKTLVACVSFLTVQASGAQSAFLVPTEILAEQHFRTLQKYLTPFQIRMALLTKSVDKKRRTRLVAELKHGKIDLVVGTHALLQDDVFFKKLGLVVIDEQHKFGVLQRKQLLERKPCPHFLIMTATPIPRSLALAIYANADLSSIRELPKGRKPIQTYWISRHKQPEVWEHLRKKFREKRQAYVIFPLIDESEKADLKAAETEFKRLKEKVFPEFRVELVHGRIPAASRNSIMKSFAAGEVDLLVATTVIEVGVDQPNATVMIIENAERFGLAQLHQLRGRIGRGEHASECFLFGEPSTDEGKARLRLLTKIQDGFEIAEEDLKLRGPGDLWGERQSGVPHFKLAHPVWNLDILQQAKAEAEACLINEPNADWIKKYLAETLRSY